MKSSPVQLNDLHDSGVSRFNQSKSGAYNQTLTFIVH